MGWWDFMDTIQKSLMGDENIYDINDKQSTYF